jgi:hypothetical protein
MTEWEIYALKKEINIKCMKSSLQQHNHCHFGMTVQLNTFREAQQDGSLQV